MTTSMDAAFPHGFDGDRWNRMLGQRVLVAAFALDDWQAWNVEAVEIIDAHERERVRRQRQETHRERLALAYALRRLFLSRVLDLPPERVPLLRDAQGRPLLEGLAIETSLSHADGYVAVAAGQHGPVGVDIEAVDRAVAMPEIAGRVCHGDELLRIARLDAAEQASALLKLWVRKEAFLKAAGVGLAREMDTFALPEGRSQALHPGQAANADTDLLELGRDVICAVSRRPGVACVAGWVRPAGRSDRG